MIHQNHGLLIVGSTVDGASYLFQLMEKLYEIQSKVEAISATGTMEKLWVPDAAAKYTCEMGEDPVGVSIISKILAAARER
jgi:ribulose-5-phosphate 4-epimerase/fuculose-1-phosphate aldolase